MDANDRTQDSSPADHNGAGTAAATVRPPRRHRVAIVSGAIAFAAVVGLGAVFGVAQNSVIAGTAVAATAQVNTDAAAGQSVPPAGSDEKILAVPVAKVFEGYGHIEDIAQVSGHWMERIGHFFEHYKDLEKGKWVKISGWGGADEAKQILLEAMKNYEGSSEKPKY